MKTSLLMTIALIATAGLTTGCDTRSCTLVGWQEGLAVRVTSDKPVTAGNYRFVMDIPGQSFDFSLLLEDPKNTREGIIVSEHIVRDPWQINASLTGYKTSASGDVSIGRFKGETGGPDSLSLTVLQDDVEIGALQLDAIQYEQHELNGPGCGVATTASASIVITPKE